MQLSSRGRYAMMAMAELAWRGDGAVATVSDIAASQQLSQCYLEQLFAGLRRAGLVCAARGPGGGYRLARCPAQMSIAAIFAAVDEKLEATRCETGVGGCLQDPAGGRTACRTHDLWAELGQQIFVFLDAVTLADVVQGRVRGRARAPIPEALGREVLGQEAPIREALV